MSRIVKSSKQRDAKPAASRRVSKSDNRFAKLAEIKASNGIVLPEVRKVLLDRKKADATRTSRRSGIMYPSEMSRGDWCPRATYYRMSGVPEPESSTSFNLENVFAEGNTIHNKWQAWLSDTGKLWGDWRCSRCSEYVKDSLKPDGGQFGSCVGTEWIDLYHHPNELVAAYKHDWKYKEVTLRSTSLPVSGHADGALVNHDCLIELKSLGVGSLRFEAPNLLEQNTFDVKGRKITDIDGIWKSFHRPLSSHVRQGNLYLWMAREMGLPFKKISFVYEFKSNNQSKEFVVPYSESIVQPMLDTAQIVVDSLAKKMPPACPKGGCMKCKPYERDRAGA